MKGFQPTIGFLVGRLALRWQLAMDRALAPVGLTHTQYAVLASLRALSQQEDAPNQQRLAEFTAFNPMHISKLVRTLQGAGFIERTDDPADPRAYRLRLTARAAPVLMSAVKIVRELQSQLVAPLSPSRQEAFRRDLELLLSAQAPNGGDT